MSETHLTHVDESGQAKMVDVGAKPDSERVAVAGGEVHLKAETVELIRQGLMKKGDVLSVAKLAGVMGAKRTSELIPLCHPIALTQVEVDLKLSDTLPGVLITASARTVGKSGVEMEVLAGVTVAALTVYDLVKAGEQTARTHNVRLVEKH